VYWDGISPLRAFYRQPILARYFFINSAIRVLWHRVTGRKLRLKRYAGRIVHSIEEANRLMTASIGTSAPFMAGRFGSSELTVVTRALLQHLGLLRGQSLEFLQRAAMCNGLFPVSEETGSRFMEVMLESMAQLDLLGAWRMVMEDYYIRYYTRSDVFLTHRHMFDFWLSDVPFTASLKGKRVLVIHPFERSIRAQYQRRETLFENEQILPDFDLKTLKAVQSIAGSSCRHKTWFDALDAMYDDAMAIDFDVAILGCGAYGFPLAARLKKAGKTAIHMGGVTQVLFGIKGKRWDEDPLARKLYNSNWIRPHESEIPARSHVVEGGCYW
jgi:hypothetical protein